MERDSQSIINMLNGQIQVSQDVCVVLNDVRALGRNFHSCIFSFSRRSTNNVAHVLACKGLVGEGCSFWTESPPTWILDPLFRDRSSA
ncbi:hypothetical protein RHMOL_Rhmol13G0208700 [Rhododendron molle]|nr:hypothetical protein RHMOL_Rhmol13G0208700 [Rhododendron molle]